jgi:D-3-phosphoglycerate dehydrogenase
MTKVLIATDKPFAPIAITKMKKVLDAAGFEMVLLERYTEVSQFTNAIADVDAVIVRSDLVTPEVLAAAKNLKIVVRAGAGYDNIDLKAATEAGVVVMNTPGQNSNAVAELAFGMMVMMARGGYDGKTGTELRNKSLGIHAYGNVGKYVAKIAQGFGMEVYAFDPFVSKEAIEADGVTALASVEELYETCQYISLHIPANDKTKKSIGYQLLSKMPDDGVLINTARKEVIHEEELMQLMSERPKFKYLSDIAPDNAAQFIEKLAGRCFFTPKKMGAQTNEANINAGVAAADQIVDFIKNGNTTYKVN